MIEACVLSEDDPVELLEGWIVSKMPRNPQHDGTIQIASERIREILPNGWVIRSQSAITTEDSEPEPDLCIARGNTRSFLERHPAPNQIGVLIEVANSSLEHDRTVKGRTYAKAGIALYWIINLNDRLIEVYSNPSNADPSPTYLNRLDFSDVDRIPFILDDVEIGGLSVRELLP